MKSAAPLRERDLINQATGHLKWKKKAQSVQSVETKLDFLFGKYAAEKTQIGG